MLSLEEEGELPAGFTRVRRLTGGWQVSFPMGRMVNYDKSFTLECTFRAETLDCRQLIFSSYKGRGDNSLMVEVTALNRLRGWIGGGEKFDMESGLNQGQEAVLTAEYTPGSYRLTCGDKTGEAAVTLSGQSREPLCLLMDSRSSANTFSGMRISLCAFRWTEDGETVMELVPALDTAGVPCLWDRINQQALYNNGEGAVEWT